MPGWTDGELLQALHMRDVEGRSYTDIGARFGRSKSAMAGAFNRIDRETDESDPQKAGDGTMPEKWWKAGIGRRPA